MASLEITDLAAKHPKVRITNLAACPTQNSILTLGLGSDGKTYVWSFQDGCWYLNQETPQGKEIRLKQEEENRVLLEKRMAEQREEQERIERTEQLERTRMHRSAAATKSGKKK